MVFGAASGAGSYVDALGFEEIDEAFGVDAGSDNSDEIGEGFAGASGENTVFV